MPHFVSNNFSGHNFSVSNDRVLDNLRVRQPNTFKLPPATKKLINPNHEEEDDGKLVPVFGDNDPETNLTLRSGVSQAGSLVYSTTPILNSAGIGEDPVDGCFDGRNHLYFSDGDQWIPLANCLPKTGAPENVCAKLPQIGEQWFAENQETTDGGSWNVVKYIQLITF